MSPNREDTTPPYAEAMSLTHVDQTTPNGDTR